MKTKLYFLIKLANSVTTTVWGMLFTFVFVRTFSLEVFSHYILIAAIGSYVLIADLGLSNVIYVALRRGFLDGDMTGIREEAIFASVTYAGIAALATLIFGAGLLIAPLDPTADRVDYLLYFLFWALALPWAMFRMIACAVDKFLYYELVEFARRVLVTCLLLLLMMGFGLTRFLIVANLIWFACLGVLGWQMSGWLGLSGLRAWDVVAAGRTLYRDRIGSIGNAAAFSISEFLIYTFPYFFVPAAIGTGMPLVIFDTFYKVYRFGAVSFRVSSEALLPQQTRAVQDGDQGRLFRLVRSIFLLGLVAAVPAVLMLLIGGPHLFALLLGRGRIIPMSAIFAMSLMIFFVLVQSTAGSILLNTGHFKPISRLAMTMAAGMATISAATLALGLDIDEFLFAYTLVYALGALGYVSLLWRHLLRPGVLTPIPTLAGAGLPAR
jgi:O-antigen/teichoic acid export membrane protein